MELKTAPYIIVSSAQFSQSKSWGIGSFTLGNTFYKLNMEIEKVFLGIGNTFLGFIFSILGVENLFLESVFSFLDIEKVFLGFGNHFPGFTFSLTSIEKMFLDIEKALNYSEKQFLGPDFLFFDFRNMADGCSYIEFKTFDKSQGKYIYNNKI
jgi:hypothetical protein